MNDGREPPRSPETAADMENEVRAAETLGRKILRVHDLDWVDMSVRDDGRFQCELKKPIAALTPAQARSLAARLEPVLERLRKQAGG